LSIGISAALFGQSQTSNGLPAAEAELPEPPAVAGAVGATQAANTVPALATPTICWKLRREILP